jgi:hypothetical protein
MQFLGDWSLKRKGPPNGSALKPTLDDGLQKFTSSTLSFDEWSLNQYKILLFWLDLDSQFTWQCLA